MLTITDPAHAVTLMTNIRNGNAKHNGEKISCSLKTLRSARSNNVDARKTFRSAQEMISWWIMEPRTTLVDALILILSLSSKPGVNAKELLKVKVHSPNLEIGEGLLNSKLDLKFPGLHFGMWPLEHLFGISMHTLDMTEALKGAPSLNAELLKSLHLIPYRNSDGLAEVFDEGVEEFSKLPYKLKETTALIFKDILRNEFSQENIPTRNIFTWKGGGKLIKVEDPRSPKDYARALKYSFEKATQVAETV